MSKPARRSNITKQFILAGLVGLAASATAQTSPSIREITQAGDEDQRERNTQHDWWLVSTAGYGNDQHRFYIDRGKMVSMEPTSRAWVDHYYLTSGKVVHDKVLMEASCNDRAPRLGIKVIVVYGDGSTDPVSSESNNWSDVVPDTSQETQWRFICHSSPANAIVFVPDGPESDARRHFAKAK
jgi:hypothetical protein